MKIGFEAKRVFRNFTGLGNYSRAVVKVLAENYPANQYILYTPKTNEKNINGLDLSLPNISIKTATVKFLKSVWRILGVTKDLKKDRITLYHGLSNELPLNIKNSGIPSVVTIHDLIFIRYPHYFSFIDRQIYRYKFKKACLNADRIIAISRQTKKDIIDFFKIDSDKIDIVYQGCDPVFKKRFSEQELLSVKTRYNLPDKYILCVGTVERRKNQLLILQSLVNLGNDIHAVITGKATEYKQELLEFIDRNNLQNRVHFLQDVPFEDLPLVYQLAQIFVYPSRFEGFGIPLLEALNCGVPVIGATGSCLEEAGGPNSLYVSPDNPEELTSCISQVLNDENLKTKMIEEGLKYARQFSEENIAKNLMAVYQKTLQNV